MRQASVKTASFVLSVRIGMTPATVLLSRLIPA